MKYDSIEINVSCSTPEQTLTITPRVGELKDKKTFWEQAVWMIEAIFDSWDKFSPVEVNDLHFENDLFKFKLSRVKKKEDLK